MKHLLPFAMTLSLLLATLPGAAAAEESEASETEVSRDESRLALGFKLRGGGRYDNVRMCIGSDAGVKGGPAADLSFFVELPMASAWTASINIPLFRPILFGAAIDMLQLEPEVAFLYRHSVNDSVDLVVGPAIGISLHYGPDYQSERSGEERGDSFFALGPMIGGYIGLDFPRPGSLFNFQLGFSPYVTPMFSVNDPDEHQGVIVGGTLDLIFRFTP